MKIGNIKFKAKRLDNNSWVFGYFYEENGKTYIIENRQKESILNRNITYEVDPSTVCQFTGLKDCEGNEVWEGDIVEFETYDLYKGNVKAEAVIKYISSGYVAVTDGIPYSLQFKRIKVIGNKFNNK